MITAMADLEQFEARAGEVATMLKALASREDWAADVLEEVFLDDEVQQWAESSLLES